MGIISIVWGSLGMCGGVCTAFNPGGFTPGASSSMKRSIGGVVVAVVTMPRMQAWIQSNPQDPVAQMLNRPGMWAFAFGMTIVSLVVSMAWPGFCLVWFGLLGKGRAAPGAANDARPMAYPGQRE